MRSHVKKEKKQQPKQTNKIKGAGDVTNLVEYLYLTHDAFNT